MTTPSARREVPSAGRRRRPRAALPNTKGRWSQLTSTNLTQLARPPPRLFCSSTQPMAPRRAARHTGNITPDLHALPRSGVRRRGTNSSSVCARIGSQKLPVSGTRLRWSDRRHAKHRESSLFRPRNDLPSMGIAKGSKDSCGCPAMTFGIQRLCWLTDWGIADRGNAD